MTWVLGSSSPDFSGPRLNGESLALASQGQDNIKAWRIDITQDSFLDQDFLPP